jgi:hypothetical protein
VGPRAHNVRVRDRNAVTPQDDTRVQLEGAVETIEAALSEHRWAWFALLAPGWRGRLRRGVATRLGAIADNEEPISEAVRAFDRRAAMDGWTANPAGLPRSGTLRAWSERLGRLAQRRLAAFGFDASHLPLAECVRKLSELGARPAIQLPPQDERIVESRSASPAMWVAALAAAGFAADYALINAEIPKAALFFASVATAILGMGMALFSNRYWLTERKLVVQPVSGEPFEIPLNTLRDGDVRIDFPGFRFSIQGQRKLAIWAPLQARRLAALVEILRLTPSRLSGRPDVAVDIITNAKLMSCDDTGVAVIRPHYVAFVPSGDAFGTTALREFCGRASDWVPSVRVPVELLIERLAAGGEGGFDPVFASIVDRCGGVYWPKDTVACDAFPHMFTRERGWQVVFRAATDSLFVPMTSITPVLMQWQPRQMG